MKIGVCYYPEHWDRSQWPVDAQTMAACGISVVRLAEFAWAALEPEPGQYDWAWLDDVMDLFHQHEIDVILGTPTATPPKWLIDQHPEILSHDEDGHPRRFGSRRHYCFSSPVYRKETARIVAEMARRYGAHPALTGWQTDNEYGCHDTVRSYSPAAQTAFRDWLRARYDDIASLNTAWGTRFWSQTYRQFSEIDLPMQTVTEANPAHRLDFYRFSSDQVVSYNRLQADILKTHSPEADIYHNFMGHFLDFDHFDLGKDIDVAVWDSYPLGFLDQEAYSADDKRKFMRQGHPDFAGLHHDLYRACAGGRWGVMEQQPGPVNWAPNNPAPLPGMVRLWGHEARAHGAELFSVFRWRQAPFAQENLHAGMRCVNDRPAPAYGEVEALSREVADHPLGASPDKAAVALVFSYETAWMSAIKPQGTQWDYFFLVLNWYKAVRELGQNVDIVPPGHDLSGYTLVLVPSLMHVSPAAADAFLESDAELVFGPRTDSFTQSMQIPAGLGFLALSSILPLTVVRAESFPAFHEETAEFGQTPVRVTGWLDHIDTALAPRVMSDAGHPLYVSEGRAHYVAGIPDAAFLDCLMTDCLEKAGIAVQRQTGGQRQRTVGSHHYTVNYGPSAITLATDNMLASGREVPVGGVGLTPKRQRSSLT
ncbi:MAG: beta-galactosidase [Pseudomonadota bacterium]